MNEFCENTVLPLNQTPSTPQFINNVNVSLLAIGCRELKNLTLEAAIEAKYSEPMPLIGYYIAVATVFFIWPVTFDLLKARSLKKLWVPCKYISLNAAYITIMAVAIKLPMDLTSPMPDMVDQVAKLGSLGFLCSVLSYVIPSLVLMDRKSLISNVTALSILVITVIVNVCIQLKTGVINGFLFREIAYIYVGMLFFLLLIYVASAITILAIRKDLEFMYHASKYPPKNLMSTPKDLRDIVKRYWIMADTDNPQFVMASTPLSIASSMISALSLPTHIFLLTCIGHQDFISMKRMTSMHPSKLKESASVYRFTTAIVYSQAMVIVAVFCTSILRCYSVFRFKLSANQNRNHFSVFKVEKYLTRRRSEWKPSNLSSNVLLSSDRLTREFIQEFWGKLSTKIVVLIQKVVVVLCKLIELIPIIVIIFAKCISPYSKMLEEKLADKDEELIKYVFLLEYDKQLAKHLVRKSLESFCRILTRDTEIPQYNLLKLLLEKSVAFDGVVKFDTDQIQPLLPFKLVNSWSLPIISLACIATTIPGIDEDVVDNLFRSVVEGLFFTGIVEESLNKESGYVHIQRARMNDEYESWGTDVIVAKTPTEIIKWFSSRAEEIWNEFKRSSESEGLEMDKDNLPLKVISANSMYRTAQTIIHTYDSSNLEITKDELFSRLSTMIADIFAACFTNLPRAILTHCHESRIEKRQESVKLAVALVNEASQIIEKLEKRVLPNMDPDKMAYIDEWRLHFGQP